MKKFIILLACLGLLSFTGMAQAGTAPIDFSFENLHPGNETYGLIPTDFAGFTWENAAWITSSHLPGTGYPNNTLGPVAGFTYYEENIRIAGSAFTFIGGYFGAAWYDDQYVTVEGWLDGIRLYSSRFLAPWTGPNYFEFNWERVNELRIIPDLTTGAAHNPDAVGWGHHIVFDNLNATYHTPLPGAVWLLGSGLLGLACLKKFRKK